VDRDVHELARALMRICVVGGGWAGIAAAVEGVRQGHSVTLVEMAGHLGGRARRVRVGSTALDNGQHILIGAYTETLRLMAAVGTHVDKALVRRPLELLYPDDSGLELPAGNPVAAFVRGVVSARGWTWAERVRLLKTAASWAAMRFRCEPSVTVAELVSAVPRRVRDELIDPLCVAALNTPAALASASVFLRVLRDALFSGHGSADLLLPSRSLSDLLPDPAQNWLEREGGRLRLGTRASRITPGHGGWRVDGETFDHVVLACSAAEAARLTNVIEPRWSAAAASFDYEPIVTVYFHSPGTRLARPMVALRTSPDWPAQFVFDHGCLGGSPGMFAAVVSGARRSLAAGADRTAKAVCNQLTAAFPAGTWRSSPMIVRTIIERRATFLCTPGLNRPRQAIAPGLTAAGDYVEGPYPATLEGAVRSGLSALRQRRAESLASHDAGQLFAMQK
jgi:squalene-associated FAD-dependent desaturase